MVRLGGVNMLEENALKPVDVGVVASSRLRGIGDDVLRGRR